MITIRQIAAEAGVSKSTVSRYLNNGYVSEEVAKKIKKIIDKHNYSPNEFARNLKIERSKFIGVVIPRLDSPSMTSILTGIDRTVRQEGYQILIANTDLNPEREIESLYNFAQNKVAGIILVATELTENHLAVLNSLKLPALVIGQSSTEVFVVNHDNYGAGKLLAQKLLPYGHSHVTYVGVTESDVSIGIQRKQGVIDTFYTAGITVKTVASTFHTNDVYRLGLELFRENPGGLYIAATDNMAIGLYRAAHDLELTIGGNLSVAGFGGYSFGEFLSPPLTTVDFHHVQVGETAASHVIQQILGEAIPRETLIPVSFLARESVGYGEVER